MAKGGSYLAPYHAFDKKLPAEVKEMVAERTQDDQGRDLPRAGRRERAALAIAPLGLRPEPAPDATGRGPRHGRCCPARVAPDRISRRHGWIRRGLGRYGRWPAWRTWRVARDGIGSPAAAAMDGHGHGGHGGSPRDGSGRRCRRYGRSPAWRTWRVAPRRARVAGCRRYGRSPARRTWRVARDGLGSLAAAAMDGRGRGGHGGSPRDGIESPAAAAMDGRRHG